MINNILYALIVTLPVAGWLLYKLPFWEAGRDYVAIQANGSADTLHASFHFWRGVRRGVLQGGIVCAAAAPLLPHSFISWLLLAAGLGVGGLGWFFFRFNTKLSELRGLDPYYISSDPRAAFFPDRYVYRHAFDAAPVTASGSYVASLARRSFKALATLLLCIATAAALLLGALVYLTY